MCKHTARYLHTLTHVRALTHAQAVSSVPAGGPACEGCEFGLKPRSQGRPSSPWLPAWGAPAWGGECQKKKLLGQGLRGGQEARLAGGAAGGGGGAQAEMPQPSPSRP